MLAPFGTVIAKEGDQALIQVPRQPCLGCPGSCLFMQGDCILTLQAALPVGRRMRIELASGRLTGVLGLVFGLPIVTLLAGFLVTGGPLSALIGIGLGCGTVWLLLKGSALRHLVLSSVRVSSLDLKPD